MQKTQVSGVLWVIYFCYAICAALIFQKLLLPLIPSMHAGGGLVVNDSVYFDSVAAALADTIRHEGWGSWRLFPAIGAPGNVGILGALYAIFGHDPTIIIPVNAALHALGGVLIFLLAFELSGRISVGTYAGLVAGTLFVVFPSALSWYGQMHKDGYAIAGMLLILLVWVKAVKMPVRRRTWYWLAAGNFAGMLLVGIVRPYALKLLLIAAAIVLLAIIVHAVTCRKKTKGRSLGVFFLVAVLTFGLGVHLTQRLNQDGYLQMGETYKRWEGAISLAAIDHPDAIRSGDMKWQWESSPWVPDVVENYIETAARTRAGLIAYGVRLKAGSMIDEDTAPRNVVEVLAYLPRALQIAVLAPFPSSWFEQQSLTRLVATGEMILYYLCLPGLFFLLYYNRSPAVLMALFFSCFFLFIYGFTQANIGTLYRYRYAYTSIVMLLGAIGWFFWLEQTGRLARYAGWLQSRARNVASFSGDMLANAEAGGRKRAVTSGLIVLLLTLLGFIGFFVRDILMARYVGLGPELDYFFIALLIPMFLVTVLCMPLGAAFIPVYLESREKSPAVIQSLIGNVSLWVSIFLMLICLVLYAASSSLLALVYPEIHGGESSQLMRLSNMALLVLLFSGVVILGNSVLNANGRMALTSAAQLVVPVVAIGALLAFGKDFGLEAVMAGMVVGQLLNLAVIQVSLKKQNLSLMPKWNGFAQSTCQSLAGQYVPLAASAFFVSIAATVSTLLATSLPGGAVSAFNLGNKLVLFFTGLVGAAMTTVLLPYFSSLVAKNHWVSARRELSFFLILATFISVPVSAIMFVYADGIVQLLFEGGTFDRKSSAEVSRVMQYALVQLPFFVSNAILLKFAIATRHVLAISIAAIIGLLANVATTLLLMQFMGVGGIALGVSVSVVVSTVFLVLTLFVYRYIALFDVVVMMLNWVLFITLLVAVHFYSVPSMIVALIAYAFLLIGYLWSLTYDNPGRLRWGR